MNDEYENELLKKLEGSTGESYKETLLDLVQFYRSIGKYAKTFEYLRAILKIYCVNDDWKSVSTPNEDVFPQQLFKRRELFNIGCGYYPPRWNDADAPPSKECQYEINERFSFFLSLSGRYKEAETICRESIEMCPVWSSAYINLGISLEGQGRYREAAESYRNSMMADKTEWGMERIDNLIEKHPELRMIRPTAEERNEFHKSHGSDMRWATIFSGEVNEEEIKAVLAECNEVIRNNPNARRG